MLRKFKFFLIGLIPSLIIVFFILNQKGVSCSGYLPESRVIAETLSKEAEYGSNFKSQMDQAKITETFLKDSIIALGGIDFSRSHAQKNPCPDYLLFYPKKNRRFEVTYTKCKEKITFNSLKRIK